MDFWGVPLGSNDVNATMQNEVQVFLTYIPKNNAMISFENLATAYDLYLRDDYGSIILPCSTSVEYALKMFINVALSKAQLPTNHNISMRVLLEVISPLVAQVLSIPFLEKRIIGEVVKLWSFRNQMAHNGFLKNDLKINEAAPLLAASMFTVNYLTHYSQVIMTVDN